MDEPEFKIEGDELVLRLSLDALKSATECSPVFDDVAWDEKKGDFRNVKVTNAAEWARAVMLALHDESEDGTTAIHRMFDGALMAAYEAGAEGICIK